MLLKDRVAIITGGARGMGRAIALRFAGEGCSSVIVDLLDKDGEKTVADIKKADRDAIYIRCDVTSAAQVKGMVAKAADNESTRRCSPTLWNCYENKEETR